MERSVGNENKELRGEAAGKYEVIFKIIEKNKHFKVWKPSTIQLKRKLVGNKREKDRKLFDSTIAF